MGPHDRRWDITTRPRAAPGGRPAWRGAVVALALLAGLAHRLDAQEGTRAEREVGVLEGTVEDAATARPVYAARVTLTLLDRSAGTDMPTRVTRTDVRGLYRFRQMRDGEYRIEVHALGYTPRRLVTRLDARANAAISIGMTGAPVRLAAVRIERVGSSYGRLAAAPDRTGLLAERLRDRAHVSGDVRLLTHEDVRRTVGIGVADPLRALQRTAGVSARDDYTSALWVRGAAWDQTRVTLDGVPLFNPMHAVGLVSMVDPNAISSATHHVGLSPVEHEAGAACAVDVRTRPGGSGQLRGVADLSLLNGGTAWDGTLAGDRVAWMVAARRSYVDLLTRAYAAASGRDERALPYAFTDLTTRWDLRLGDSWTLEATGLHGTDALRASIERVVDGATARWGTTAGQLALRGTLWGGEVRQALSFSDARAAVRSEGGLAAGVSFQLTPDTSAEAMLEQLYKPQPLRSAITYLSASGSWTRAAAGTAGAETMLGYRIVRERSSFETAGMWPFRARLPSETRDRASQGWLSLTARARRQPLRELTTELGLRADFDGRRGARHPLLAPQLSAPLRATESLRLWSAFGVALQREQSITPPSPGRDGVVVDGLLWVLAGPDAPVLRSSHASVGADQWIGDAHLVSLALFDTRDAGRLMEDPRPGSLLDRPLFAVGTSSRRGVEIGARRLVGRTTGEIGWSRVLTRVQLGGARFDAPSVRPSVLRGSAQHRLSPALSVGMAATGADGVSYVRRMPGAIRCERGTCRWIIPPAVRDEAMQRSAPYRALDLSLDWRRTDARRPLGVSVQLHNVTNHRNDAAYTATEGVCAAGVEQSSWCTPLYNATRYVDRRLPSLGIVPALAVHMSF